MKEIELRVAPDALGNNTMHEQMARKELRIPPTLPITLQLHRRSIDARGGKIRFILRYRVYIQESVPVSPPPDWKHVHQAPPVLIIGFGPAGMFAALRCLELGLKPIVLERGKPVRDRRRDLAVLNREGLVHPDSNYCFGEGGAGTFSDGKLYTRSGKRGDIDRILQRFVWHGANNDILVDAHPHIGTNKLPEIVEAIRQTIVDHGGEIHFNRRVDAFHVEAGSIRAVQAGGDRFDARAVMLATGHSARDIYDSLHRSGIQMEAKPFALGVRVEHPQALVDEIRWRCSTRPEYLPAASYAWVEQVQGRGVFSFCMCPGGIICPASTSNDELVVNGWSPSKRNSKFANSGIVTEIGARELGKPLEDEPLALLHYQAETEQRAFVAGGGRQVAPAQRLTDFISGKVSETLPECSYLPGLASADLTTVFPGEILQRLRIGFRQAGTSLRGYLTSEAVVVATESRTSAPVRIPRDRYSGMHPQVAGLFPCGEGAGYAGGIVSAAMDGEWIAERMKTWLS